MTFPGKLHFPLNPILRSMLAATLLVTCTGCGLIGVGVGTAISLIPLKLLFKCLPEGTEIDTPGGSTAIENLRPGDMVVGFRGDPVKVLQIQGYVEDHSVEDFVEVEFLNGSKVNLCKLHRIDGTRAGKLGEGDVLKCGHVIKSIRVYGGVERSYDILTEDEGYQVEGIPVNSMIKEMYEYGHTAGEMKP